jgi:heme/copper-type cytochrome/quinol oxidase subunit 2
MSGSLQSLMVDLPVKQPKRSRLRRATMFTLIAAIVIVGIVLFLTVAGVKFVLMQAGGLFGRL